MKINWKESELDLNKMFYPNPDCYNAFICRMTVSVWQRLTTVHAAKHRRYKRDAGGAGSSESIN